MNKNLKGFLTCSAILLGFLAGLENDTVYASPIEESNQKIENILLSTEENKQKTQELLDLINEQETKNMKLNDEISVMHIYIEEMEDLIAKKEKQVSDLQETIKEREAFITRVNGQIKELQEGISEKENNISFRKDVLSKRMQSLQVRGTPNILDVLFNATSLTDFLTQSFALTTLNQANKDLMDALLVDIDMLEIERQGLLSKREDLEQSKKAIENEKTDEERFTKDLKNNREELVQEKNNLLTMQTKSREDSDNLRLEVEQLKDYLLVMQVDLEKEIQKVQSLITTQRTVLQNNLRILEESQQREISRNLEDISEKDVDVPELVSVNPEDLEKLRYEIQQKEAELQRLTNVSNNISNVTNRVDNVKLNISDNSDKQKRLVKGLQKHIGVPYVWGGANPSGFDCSGLIVYVFKQELGMNLPRVTQQQQHLGVEVPAFDIQVGDLIFWGEPAYHVGVYVGDGYYIHAPEPGDNVKYAKINFKTLSHIRRVL